ncbi:175_t:CDS:1, partial [Gigaspora margarita]
PKDLDNQLSLLLYNKDTTFINFLTQKNSLPSSSLSLVSLRTLS